MDDEAAAEQLRSEARASYSAHHNDDAIPLNLDGANSPEIGKKKAKKLEKLGKLGRLGKSGKPKRADQKHLAASRTSPAQLSTHIPAESPVVAAESPSKTQVLVSTAPSTQIEVPNSQVANGDPTSTPATEQHAASPSDPKSKSAKRKRKRQAEVEAQDEVIPATPEEAVDEGQSSHKRRKKHQSQTSVHSTYADAQEAPATPGATQEIPSQAAPREDQNGVEPAPLTPKILLENLKAERSQKSQGSQFSSKAHSSGRRKQKVAVTSTMDVDTEEPVADVEEEPVEATGSQVIEEISGTPQGIDRKKKSKKNKHILEAPDLKWEAPVRGLEDGPPTFPTFDEVEATESIEAPRKEKKKRKTHLLVKSEESTPKSSRYSVGGLPRSPSKRPSKHDPNKNYERARDEDDRTAADRALESSKDLGHPPELRANGDYSLDEDELLRRAIRDFQQREGLETADLVRIIHWMPTREDPATENTSYQAETELKKQSAAFWEEVKGTGLRRKMKNVKEHVRATYHTYRRGPWSTDEDDELTRLVELHPNQWKTIAAYMNRPRGDVFNRWKDYVQHGPDRITKRWSVEEEETFIKVLSTVIQRIEDDRANTGKPPLADPLASINWSQVCTEMGNTRSRLQCQYKLKQMRARVPPPTFDFEIKPRRSPHPDEMDLDPISDGEDGGESTIRSGADAGRKQKEQKKQKKTSKTKTKTSKKQDFKSAELVAESDNAESELEG